MLLGNRVMLQPTENQIQDFIRFAGTSRFVWNECKRVCDSLYAESKEYATLQYLIEHIQELKYNNPNYTWLQDVPEAVAKQAIKDLLKAYSRFYRNLNIYGFDSKEPDKYRPKYKKRGKCKLSFYQRVDNLHKTDDIHIKITGIKKPVKCRALKGVDLPDKIKNPRVSFDGKYWYLSYSVEVESIKITGEYEVEYLGIDLGVKDLAVFSTGEHFSNINKGDEVRKLTKRLKRLQKQVSRKYESNVTYDSRGNKVYHKTNNIKKLEREIKLLNRRIVNIRKTYMYEVIKSAVRTKPQTIVLEDLNVSGMLQNPKLAKVIQEESLYEFRRILTYKCELNGINLVIADRWFPSSKRCSCCGEIKQNLTLKDRIFRCDHCGFTADRDENGALNLALYPNLSMQ